MNKELEALLLTAAKAIGYGVHGADPKRAAQWGVPVSVFVPEGRPLDGWRSKRAKVTGYYCPGDSRPKNGLSLTLDHYASGGGYMLMVLSENTSGQFHFAGHCARMPVKEMKAYLRGIADGAGRP